MDRCQLFSDDWTMPGRTTEVCGCGNPARNHPRKPNLVTQPGNYFKSYEFIEPFLNILK
jgi:hypothetical protein